MPQIPQYKSQVQVSGPAQGAGAPQQSEGQVLSGVGDMISKIGDSVAGMIEKVRIGETKREYWNARNGYTNAMGELMRSFSERQDFDKIEKDFNHQKKFLQDKYQGQLTSRESKDAFAEFHGPASASYAQSFWEGHEKRQEAVMMDEFKAKYEDAIRRKDRNTVKDLMVDYAPWLLGSEKQAEAEAMHAIDLENVLDDMRDKIAVPETDENGKENENRGAMTIERWDMQREWLLEDDDLDPNDPRLGISEEEKMQIINRLKEEVGQDKLARDAAWEKGHKFIFNWAAEGKHKISRQSLIINRKWLHPAEYERFLDFIYNRDNGIVPVKDTGDGLDELQKITNLVARGEMTQDEADVASHTLELQGLITGKTRKAEREKFRKMSPSSDQMDEVDRFREVFDERIETLQKEVEFWVDERDFGIVKWWGEFTGALDGKRELLKNLKQEQRDGVDMLMQGFVDQRFPKDKPSVLLKMVDSMVAKAGTESEDKQKLIDALNRPYPGGITLDPDFATKERKEAFTKGWAEIEATVAANQVKLKATIGEKALDRFQTAKGRYGSSVVMRPLPKVWWEWAREPEDLIISVIYDKVTDREYTLAPWGAWYFKDSPTSGWIDEAEYEQTERESSGGWY